MTLDLKGCSVYLALSVLIDYFHSSPHHKISQVDFVKLSSHDSQSINSGLTIFSGAIKKQFSDKERYMSALEKLQSLVQPLISKLEKQANRLCLMHDSSR